MLARCSFFNTSFSICFILKVSPACIMAMIKYMISKKKSSAVLTWKVNRGGIKKKFQVNALNTAENSTGNMSKEIAINETVSSSIKAITLYPRNGAMP